MFMYLSYTVFEDGSGIQSLDVKIRIAVARIKWVRETHQCRRILCHPTRTGLFQGTSWSVGFHFLSLFKGQLGFASAQLWLIALVANVCWSVFHLLETSCESPFSILVAIPGPRKHVPIFRNSNFLCNLCIVATCCCMLLGSATCFWLDQIQNHLASVRRRGSFQSH